MIRNNKGMSIVEIIIAVSLVSIVLVFMINLLITVKSSSDTAQNKSTALINRAIITREIENDIKDFKIFAVRGCGLEQLRNAVGEIMPYRSLVAKTNYCLRLSLVSRKVDNDLGSYPYSRLLIQYEYEGKSYVGYIRGTDRVVRESPYIMNSQEDKGIVTVSCMTDNGEYCRETINDACPENERMCSITINMPIYDEEGNDYSIKFSFLVDRFEKIYVDHSLNSFFIANSADSLHTGRFGFILPTSKLE